MISFFHDDLTSLYRLIERLLGSTENEEIQIIAGKLPETFPDEIPFPPGATIVGSAVYVDQWRSRIQVFFDVNFNLEQLNDFYQSNLGENWNRKEYLKGGFTRISDFSPQNMEQMQFSNQTRNRELYINVVDIPRSTMMVDLELWESNASTSRRLSAPLPTLSSPPNVRILRSD